MMRKLQNFAPSMIEVALNMMLSLEDAPLAEWNNITVCRRFILYVVLSKNSFPLIKEYG